MVRPYEGLNVHSLFPHQLSFVACGLQSPLGEVLCSSFPAQVTFICCTIPGARATAAGLCVHSAGPAGHLRNPSFFPGAGPCFSHLGLSQIPGRPLPHAWKLGCWRGLSAFFPRPCPHCQKRQEPSAAGEAAAPCHHWGAEAIWGGFIMEIFLGFPAL